MPLPVGTADDALLGPDDLSGFEGAPFAPDLVLAIGEAIRDYARWHIAPGREDAVVNVRSNGGRFIFLPTLGLTAVQQVLDVTDDPEVGTLVEDYRVHTTTQFRAGVLERPTGWPVGVLNVTFDHGYESCPPQLLPVVAELCRATKRGDLSARSLGDKSEAWRDGLSAPSQGALGKFRIPRTR